MKPLIALLLILAIISNIKGDYSINTFINYLQEKGLYDLLAEIKYYFGNDVSIDFCKELLKSSHCEIVIKVYIPSKTRKSREGEPEEEKKDIVQIIDEYYEVLINAGFKNFEIDKIKLKMKYNKFID